MRKVFLLIASSIALVVAGCDSGANNNQKPSPSSYGGGPSPQQQGGSSQSTYDEGSKAERAGSAAHELPGMGGGAPELDIRTRDDFGGIPGAANESNGGSGAGATGTKGGGTTLHNGFNGTGPQTRPEQAQTKVDFGPGQTK